MQPPIKYLWGFMMLLSIGTGVAQVSNNPQQLPISLSADSGEFDANAGKATYTGHVVITQGQMNLKGDKVVVTVDKGQVTVIEAWGNLATFHYVPKNQPPIDGRARYMKYTVATSTIDMDKNAWVKQDKNETTGSHLMYNLAQEKVKGRHVNMILIPKTQ